MPVLPIVTYNDPVLRQDTRAVEENSPELQQLIDDMFQTMYNSNGVGLAAPQIGKSISLFVVDTDVMTEELEDEEDVGPLVFINPEIVKTTGSEVKLEEGCLSIPDVRDEVSRPVMVEVSFLDRDFNKQIIKTGGWLARVIQHEYDHLRGVLFLDHLSAFRRRLHRLALRKIENGKFEADYPLVPKKANKS